MGQIDFIGEKVSIGGGNTEKQDGFSGGTVDFIGEKVDLKRTSSPLGIFTDQSMGTVEFVGDKMSLKRQPHRGYESGTPQNSQGEAPDTPQSY